MSLSEREVEMYRKAINDIDDLIEYRPFTKKDIYAIIEQLTYDVWNLYHEPRYTVTPAGKAALRGGDNG